MKKFAILLSIVALFVFLTASALAFSLTLQNLNINAESFAQAVVSPVVAAPMTSNDEAQIGQPNTETVRFEDFAAPDHVCQKNKSSDSTAGF